MRFPDSICGKSEAHQLILFYYFSFNDVRRQERLGKYELMTVFHVCEIKKLMSLDEMKQQKQTKTQEMCFKNIVLSETIL